MLDKRLAWTGAALGLVAALSFFLTRPVAEPEIAPLTEPVSGIGRGGESLAPEQYDYAYILKEYEGRVAVYPAGAGEPELILDVLVKYLPDYDRTQMAAGIPIKTYDELISRIEDYTS